LLTFVKMPFSILRAFLLLMRLKPKAVLGVGGFASFPFLLVSIFTGVKTFIWEGNAYPGLVNRKLGRWTYKNFLVFEEAKKYISKNAVVIGIPIRDDFFKYKHAKNPTPPFKVLVFGGSQGSQAINLVVQKMLIKYKTVLTDFQFIHQTGAKNFDLINNLYQENNVNIKCLPYIENMPQVLNEVNICICRSGASSVAEMCATQTPAILICS
jgi:UDP-N-acetylglucosamine--N-acetylmuramyl-(pentapeptide) pyrophosphoryl-undecaprenol N-acetylglucosamine transferase